MTPAPAMTGRTAETEPRRPGEMSPGADASVGAHDGDDSTVLDSPATCAAEATRATRTSPRNCLFRDERLGRGGAPRCRAAAVVGGRLAHDPAAGTCPD